MAISRKQLLSLSRQARYDNDRLVIRTGEAKGVTVWPGLGNRSGLHSAIDGIASDKWKKSGKGLVNKLLALEPGTVVEVHVFKNKTRDRGTWSVARAMTITDEPAPTCYHLESDSRGESCIVCGVDMYEDITPIF